MADATTFEQTLYTTLSGNAGVSAIVGTKVYALVIPQGSTLPCVTFQRIDGMPMNSTTGHSGLESVLVQIDGWAKNFGQVKQLAAAIRAAMAGASFQSTLQQDRDTYDPESTYYRVSMDFLCWHVE